MNEFKIGDRVQVVREPTDPRWYRQHDVGTVMEVIGPGLYWVDFGSHHWRLDLNGEGVWAVNGDILDLVLEADEPYEDESE